MNMIPMDSLATSYRTHLCGDLRSTHIGTQVSICGWVSARREHGEHLAFLDLRDFSGVTQCVVDGSIDARSEWVLRVSGTVRRRPEGNSNTEILTGEIELGDCVVEVLNRSDPPPFPIDDRTDADESVRLRHRFIDLRRGRMQRNLRLRARVLSAVLNAMSVQGFVEVETPLLWTPTPEGAREFAVPSRLHHGDFYVLPQSPQIAKQLLMVAGTDRYFQVARCLRDEDLRADRQIEMSFASAADVQQAITRAVMAATETIPNDRVSTVQRFTWHEAMDRFGVDKPDLRFEMELQDLGDIFQGTAVRAFQSPIVKCLLVPQGSSLSRNRLDEMVDKAKILGAKGLAWFKVIEVAEGKLGFDSPLDKFLSLDERDRLLATTAATVGDVILVVADEWRVACSVLGTLRQDLGRTPVGEGDLKFCWVTEFPMFDGIDDEGRPQAAHHPFTMPHKDDMDQLADEPMSVRSEAYDLVLNGWELGSGSVRIHREDIQREVFNVLGISNEEAEIRFGFLLNAFRFGAPPHAGFAVGIDRLVAILAGEENIREVIAFPKTQSGVDLMTGAPNAISQKALRDLGLQAVLRTE